MLDALQIDRVAFSIPIPQGLQEALGIASFDIFWYGILITLGIAVGAWWGAREIEKRGQSVDDFFNGLIIVIFAGYIFARLTYVLLDVLDGAQYDSFLEVINIRAGGVNILGGFIGAALVGAIYARWRKMNLWHYADVTGVIILIAQAIGRWGNFINQELYGPPTELPWGILIEPRFRLAEYSDLATYDALTRFHPTFLYESLWLLAGAILLIVLNNRNRDSWDPGTLFSIFLIWWGGGRVWIEFFRPDQPTIGDSFVTYSMLVALGIAIVGVLLLLRQFDRGPLKSDDARRRQRRVLKPKPRRN